MNRWLACSCFALFALGCGNTASDPDGTVAGGTTSTGGTYGFGSPGEVNLGGSGSNIWSALVATCEDVSLGTGTWLFGPVVGSYETTLPYDQEKLELSGVSLDGSTPMTMSIWLNEEPQPREGCGENGYFMGATMRLQTEDGALDEKLTVRLVRSSLSQESYSFNEVLPRLDGSLSVVGAAEILSFGVGGTITQSEGGSTVTLVLSVSFIDDDDVTRANQLLAYLRANADFAASDDLFGEQLGVGGAVGF